MCVWVSEARLGRSRGNVSCHSESEREFVNRGCICDVLGPEVRFCVIT